MYVAKFIGLASATSQLDRNAWQHVATYKPGVVSTPYKAASKKHRWIEQNCPRQASALLKSYRQFSGLIFFRFRLLIVFKVPVPHLSPSRIAVVYSPALLPWERYRGKIGLFSVRGGLVFIARSSGPLDREKMKRRKIHHILRHRTISMQVRRRNSVLVGRRLRDRKEPQTRHESCPNPTFSSIMSH